MRRTFLCVVADLVALLLTTGALADRMYVLPDSDTRKQTWEEVDMWDYESLGYAFNDTMGIQCIHICGFIQNHLMMLKPHS